MNEILKGLFCVLITIALTGCDTMRNVLGLDHYQPDEFSVAENPPLSLPPDYQLRPPVQGLKEGANPSTDTTATQQAQSRLLGKNASCPTGAGTSTEQKLVHQAKAGQTAPNNIRQIVDKEAEAQSNRTILDDKLDEIAKNAASLRQEKQPAAQADMSVAN